MEIGKKSIRIRKCIKKKQEMYIERELGKLRKRFFQKTEPKQKDKNTPRMQENLTKKLNLQKQRKKVTEKTSKEIKPQNSR